MKMPMEWLERRSRWFWVSLGVSLVVLLETLDYLTGPEIAFLIFYLVPISLVTWFVGRWAGSLMCLVSAFAWLVIHLIETPSFAHPLVPYWNTTSSLAFFLIVAYALSSLKRLLEHEREMARKDHLTGTVNARAFYELAEMEINRSRRNSQPFTVAYLDIDNFKEVNDRFGHSVGDTLLRKVTQSIKNTVRKIDTVARLGGDEFAILLPETGSEAAEIVIRRVRKNLTDMTQENAWPVTFSIGVVTCDSPPQNVDKMIKMADDLMYSVKNKGKNMVKYQSSSESPATAA